MGTDDASSSNSDHSTQVMLNVYDLTPLNCYTAWFGFGIFHSGIEVHGMEYGFGAHDFPISGVFEVEPKSCPGFIFRSSVPLGYINMPPSEFRRFIESAASEYHGNTYHLLTKNCNHFTDDMAWRLTGKHIPGWVNRVAWLGTVCSCLLPESLQVTTVKQLPEYHPRTEDGSDSLSATSHEPTESEDADQDHQLLSPSTASSDVAFIKEAQRLFCKAIVLKSCYSAMGSGFCTKSLFDEEKEDIHHMIHPFIRLTFFKDNNSNPIYFILSYQISPNCNRHFNIFLSICCAASLEVR